MMNRPESNPNELLEQVSDVLVIWSHNRKLYPGWLVLPSGEERLAFGRRTGRWMLRILSVLPLLPTVERLYAVSEIVWRKEILLERMTVELADAAQAVLEVIDCQNYTVENAFEMRDDWDDVREAWISVALALVTDARLDCDQPKSKQLLSSLAPFSTNHSNAGRRISQERCLWAVYSLDFDLLNKLLDDWPVESDDPVWMLRKAALLTEANRHVEATQLIQRARNSLGQDAQGDKSIANASREGWALASMVTWDNQGEVHRQWDILASQKCDVRDEIDDIRRALRGAENPGETPSFDLGIRHTSGVRLSIGGQRRRLVAAYRAIRLTEVAGIPPVNSPTHEGRLPGSSVSDILALAAEELVTTNPELAIRLTLRISNYDRDKTLSRVLSRTRIAALTKDVTTTLAQMCINLINYAMPLFLSLREASAGTSSVERLRVALEILSRLVLRLEPAVVNSALDVGLECYREKRVAQDPWLGRPLRNLLSRAWDSLPKHSRAVRSLELLTAPIAEFEGFEADSQFPDMAEFIGADDFAAERGGRETIRYRQAVDFLIRGLRGSDGARKRATLRLIPLTTSGNLTTEETSDIARALWSDSDPVLQNSAGPNSPLDWVFLLLPEIERGSAERSFRRKWLHPSHASQGEGTAFSIRMLAQVGRAVSGLQGMGIPFEFSPEEEEYLALHIEQLVEPFYSDSVSFDMSIFSTIDSMGSLVTEISIPRNVSVNLLQRVEFMIGTQNDARDSPFSFVNDVRIALGYALILGLIKSVPERFDTFTLWLRTGLSSDSDSRIRGAMTALMSWLRSESTSASHPIPLDLIREVGAIIAAGRRGALADALLCATLVFRRGAEDLRDTIGPMALLGLSYLERGLSYELDERNNEDLHTLRFLCVQLATNMAQHGFEHDATVAKWLDIGRNDPFPEVRNVVFATS